MYLSRLYAERIVESSFVLFDLRDKLLTFDLCGTTGAGVCSSIDCFLTLDAGSGGGLFIFLTSESIKIKLTDRNSLSVCKITAGDGGVEVWRCGWKFVQLAISPSSELL